MVLMQHNAVCLSDKLLCQLISKTQIKTAVETIFGVKVEKVNTVTTQGKLKRMGRYEGRTSTVKKAYVILKKDSKAIEFFENMA